MSTTKIDYEYFLKKSIQKGLYIAETKDASKFYEELYTAKISAHATLKDKLKVLGNRNKMLKNRCDLSESFNKELLRRRVALIEKNSQLHEKIVEAEKSREVAIKNHIDIMEKLEVSYVDFTKDKCDLDCLKSNIAELMNKKRELQGKFNFAYATLGTITKSMRDITVPLLNADVLNEIKNDCLKSCGDVSGKQEKIEKLKCLIKELEANMNSN